MWFRKKKNIFLFNNELVNETDSKVTSLLKVPIATIDNEIIEKLSQTEQKSSGISSQELISIFKHENDKLIKFICLTYSRESKINENPDEVIESNGLSKGFSITYAIYYYFLKNEKHIDLGKYLSNRRIPQSQNFQERLKNYFWQSEGVMLSDSYIQYAAGYDKENVKSKDISKAIQDLQKMDDEHGAFWISVMTENDNEFVIQANKNMALTLIQGENETNLQCSEWSEVEEIFNLQIEKEFDKIISRMKK